MDLLVTILTLLVAVYAVIPRERQLDLKLKIDFMDWVVIALGFLGVFYLEFYDFALAHGWVFKRPWPEGITPRNTTYLVMVSATLFLWLRVRFAGLTARKIRKFQELVEELYWTESYGELLTLLQKHLKGLFKIYRLDFLLARIRYRFESLIRPRFDAALIEQIEAALKEDVPAGTNKLTARELRAERFFSVTRSSAPLLLKFLPKYEKTQQVAQDIIRTVLLSPRFVSALTKTRPYFGLEVIRESARCRERFDFVDAYLKELVRDSTSVFYAELVNNQNCSQHRYYLSDSNRLLHFFLSDAKVAYDNGIYKPIGDFAVAHLDELARDHGADPYNRAMGDFREVGAWQSPIFGIIRFFDIMVKEALFQGIEWHMWLYYIPLIVKGMTRNYRIDDPLADPDNEWPIRYSFLLYESFSAMRDWTMAIEDVPLTQANVKLKSTRADHENGNIPKSSILALSESSRFVLESDYIDSRQKQYLMNMVFEMYFDLRASKDFEEYAIALRTAVSQGGLFRRRADQKFRTALIDAFSQNKSEYLIKHPDAYVFELEAALQ